MRQVFNPDVLPKPGGAYSMVVRRRDMVFVAGLVGMDAERRLVEGDIEAQTRQALENLRGALDAAGATMADVCSVTVFLHDPQRDFAAFDAVYRGFFLVDPPVRATVQAHVPGGVLVEIQATAVLG